MSDENPKSFLDAMAVVAEEIRNIPQDDLEGGYDNWFPPNGTYTLQITGVRDGVKQKDYGDMPWCSVEFSILDPGEHQGRTFSHWMRLNANKGGQASRGQKDFRLLGTCIAGEPVTDPYLIRTILDAAVEQGDVVITASAYTRGDFSGVNFKTCESGLADFGSIKTQFEQVAAA